MHTIPRRDAMNLANLHLLRYLENLGQFTEPPLFLNQTFHAYCYNLVKMHPNQQPPTIVPNADKNAVLLIRV